MAQRALDLLDFPGRGVGTGEAGIPRTVSVEVSPVFVSGDPIDPEDLFERGESVIGISFRRGSANGAGRTAGTGG